MSAGAKLLGIEEIQKRLINLKGWALSQDGKTLRCDLVLRDFVAAVSLLNRIAEIAQREDHHPDLHLTEYRRLGIELSTHSVGGLSDNDFMLAAKIDDLPKELKKA